MRKKMCQNDSFYEHYSYRTDVKQIGKVSNVVTEILKINIGSEMVGFNG